MKFTAQYTEVLKIILESLGGDSEALTGEIDSLVDNYPNITLLMTDMMGQGAALAQEVQTLNEKVEILKDCLVTNGLLLKIPAPDGVEGMSVDQINEYVEKATHSSGSVKEDEPEEIKINDIVWHLQCDEDVPN